MPLSEPSIASETATPPAPESLASDILWGAAAIARELGLTDRQAFHMLEKGLLPAKKVGRKYMATRSALRAALCGAAA